MDNKESRPAAAKRQVEHTPNNGGFIGTVREAFQILTRYFFGRIVISLLIGTVCYPILWLMDAPLRLLICILVAVLNLVPYIGPAAAMAASALIVVFRDPLDAPWVVMMCFGVQLLDALVLSPLILGRTLRIPGFVIIIAILLGGSVLGIWGIIFAVPAAAIAAMIIRHIRNRRRV